MNRNAAVHEPFQEPAQQREAAFLGMYVFLATEIMLFGGLFAGILVYRIRDTEAVHEAAGHLYLWLGGLNTAVLLTSSLFMALAVQSAREGRARPAIRRLLFAAVLGITFLTIKGIEYGLDYAEGLMPGVGPEFPLPRHVQELFINLYFVATGLHSVHLTIGILIVLGLAFRLWRGQARLPERRITVEMVGLYWHLVDIVWVFLYPALYLARG